MKVIAIWGTLCVYLVLCIGGFGLAIARLLPDGDHVMTLPEILLFFIVLIPILCFGGVYLADVLWLLTWRRFSTRAEIYAVAGAGRLSRFDRWLIRRFGPQT
jgi:hypothetical protein